MINSPTRDIRKSLRRLRDLVTEIRKRPRIDRSGKMLVPIVFNSIHVRVVWLHCSVGPAV